MQNEQPPQNGQPAHGPAQVYGKAEYGQQPQYGQPGQPGNGQAPTYEQAAYWPPQYAQPGYGQPPGFSQAPKKKTRALPIALIAVAVMLVVAVGGSIAIYLAADDQDDTNEALTGAAAAPTATKAAPTAKATTAAPSGSVRIAEPKTLGGRPKLVDPQFAGLADQLQQGLTSVPGTTSTVGALYGNVAKQNIVILIAAEAPIADPERELDQSFASVGAGSGLTLEDIGSAPTGTLGGTAKCGSTQTSGVDVAVCSWADDGSLGMFVWYFTSASAARAEFPTLRAQVEKTS